MRGAFRAVRDLERFAILGILDVSLGEGVRMQQRRAVSGGEHTSISAWRTRGAFRRADATPDTVSLLSLSYITGGRRSQGPRVCRTSPGHIPHRSLSSFLEPLAVYPSINDNLSLASRTTVSWGSLDLLLQPIFGPQLPQKDLCYCLRHDTQTEPVYSPWHVLSTASQPRKHQRRRR